MHHMMHKQAFGYTHAPYIGSSPASSKKAKKPTHNAPSGTYPSGIHYTILVCVGGGYSHRDYYNVCFRRRIFFSLAVRAPGEG
jgi:hypothetical protein